MDDLFLVFIQLMMAVVALILQITIGLISATLGLTYTSTHHRGINRTAVTVAVFMGLYLCTGWFAVMLNPTLWGNISGLYFTWSVVLALIVMFIAWMIPISLKHVDGPDKPTVTKQSITPLQTKIVIGAAIVFVVLLTFHFASGSAKKMTRTEKLCLELEQRMGNTSKELTQKGFDFLQNLSKRDLAQDNPCKNLIVPSE